MRYVFHVCCLVALALTGCGSKGPTAEYPTDTTNPPPTAPIKEPPAPPDVPKPPR
jgi:predicted small lipoprotein YifL